MGWNPTSIINCGHQLVNATELMVETSPLRATTFGSITSNERTLIYRDSIIQHKGRKPKNVNLQKANSSFPSSVLVDDHMSSSSWADLCKGYPVIGCRYIIKALMDSSSQICSHDWHDPATFNMPCDIMASSSKPISFLESSILQISPADGPIHKTSCMQGSGDELPSILKLSIMSPPSWQGPNLELGIMAHLAHQSLCYWLTQGIPKDSLAVRSGLWMSSVALWTLLCGLLLLSLSLIAVSYVIDTRDVQQSCANTR
ncbi:hypothetical protein Vretimale_20112 [Volvox reticuliferus]|nr:hypothetical protein Vretimale_20112 [Volvox reticuliferus]